MLWHRHHRTLPRPQGEKGAVHFLVHFSVSSSVSGIGFRLGKGVIDNANFWNTALAAFLLLLVGDHERGPDRDKVPLGKVIKTISILIRFLNNHIGLIFANIFFVDNRPLHCNWYAF